MLHMVVGGVLGCAVYAQGLAYYVPDNLARYGSAIDMCLSAAARST